jgi:NADPH2:quinone reductase
VRAAIVAQYGEPPAVAEHADPAAQEGKTLIELRAAALNPVDLAVASGTFPAGSPPVPYVPGVEGVGIAVESQRFPAGTRVYASGAGLGVAGDGTFAERFAAAEEVLIDVPEDVDDTAAAAFGVAGIAAWLPLTWLAPVCEGESVLVLGASGAVGSIAVQAAKLLGAGRVVGVGRNPQRLGRAAAYGADATVSLQDDDFTSGLSAALDGVPPTLIVDALWGRAIEAALAVAAPRARIVQLGQSAGPTATLLSGHVRGKQLEILGYSNFAVPRDELARGYRDLLAHAAAGRITLEREAVPLDRIGEAWSRQGGGTDVKLVLVP